jgi:short-subunit dehydrogenase
LEESDATAERMVDINVNGVILGSKLALERFVPRGRGHLVNIASIAGKAGSPHVATYVATKHAVVGLTEALRLEYTGAGIDFTVVMPVGVNTELYSGLAPLRGMKTPEPEDVAEAIVEALQTARYEVYVPKRMNGVIRAGALLPRRAMDAVGKALGADMITRPDPTARAAYEQRIAAQPSGAAGPSGAAAAAEPSKAEPEPELDANGQPQPEREPEAV